MRGDQNVIKRLNQALHDELSAVVQYMVQAETCENWGYGRLAGITKSRAIEEMKHAEALIERILFLDAMPEVNVSLKPTLGKDVPQQLQAGLADETDAIREYNGAAEVCREAGDAGSKDLFERLLHDEERHADFLEAQLHSIEQMGIAAYLAQQMSK
ncbi:MAG TPA: bacterioferritin [Candidatus Binatia bacterium]|nr:bacterioferritin [Candidatus Binatia bacterium]